MRKVVARVNADGESADAAARAPRRWWQWMLVYPALAVALVSAIPTYVEIFYSKKYEVPFGQSAAAKQQNDLWQRNLSCSAAPFDGLKTDFNVEVDAIICRSGDVLVRVRAPNNASFYRWVPVDMFPIKSASAFPWSEAYAADRLPLLLAQAQDRPAPVVICQRFLEPGKVLRRVRETAAQRGSRPDGASDRCYDEVINSYNGQVLRRAPARCDARC